MLVMILSVVPLVWACRQTEGTAVMIMYSTLQAEKKMLEANYNKEYLPIEGLAEFRKATIDLMLGPNSKAQQEVRGSCCSQLQVASWRTCVLFATEIEHERCG